MPRYENKMRTQLLLILLTAWTTLLGQDGSDILYVTVDKLDKSYVGDFVHLDFYNESFLGTNDTIVIKIENSLMRFVERRKDDGLNNWFHQQYLESVDKIEGKRIKIVKSRLDKITADSVFVTVYSEFFIDDKLQKTTEFNYKFPRTIIAAVLVSAKSHKQKVK